ncbi:MAG: ATP-dependent protease LonB [Nanoarchaeota archaeon]|nr:ATP-dependent protease LonB [Nanoarchaeota archaeon]MBU4242366.1 ATP-dependent protease LonB [Nanoarchaeota archaeon]MBU4352158.1 ATP-dependent protease LonB [Nanoarchaeota archaeon]MBU4455920.1 ATP-dependent protease LonB [Nanoarchaeota archaeon]MCG2719818.1 ATP-dependent protease LonB [Nanoarchaeota archaeon]
MKLKYKTTADIKVSKNISEQVIGQEEGVNIIKKAAKQRRNVLLIGDPGTGKSMMGLALAELLPTEKLVDVLAFPNPIDDNVPIIKTMKKGQGILFVNKAKITAIGSMKNMNLFLLIFILIASILPYYLYSKQIFPFDNPTIYAASMITSMIMIIGFILFLNVSKRAGMKMGTQIPKLLIDNSKQKKVPFIDATGAHAGALLGDVLHDPLQSGGLGTPAYLRLIPGMIHRANKGVLFIDEISILQSNMQQELLTVMQEKKYPITGQSERSSGAMTRSEPVPADFIMIAAGNLETIKHMHPALRSRIRGYGYEVYMNTTMNDNDGNRERLAVFVAQEVIKDGKIPHFTKEAVDLIIHEARKMAGTSGKLTVLLRELGGLVRAAGDLALEDKSKFTEKKHVDAARKLARTLEQQLADRYIEQKKKYQVIITEGSQVGRVNGLAVIGSTTYSGIVLPIESEVTSGGKKPEFVATGKLGEIAKEAVKNVSAIILKYFGEDLREKYDIFTQFIQTHEGVEGDSASIAVATSIISALKNIPVRQDTAMTGSLTVRGEVLAVGGVSAKIEAAIEAGIKRVIIPKTNFNDVVLDKDKIDKVKIIPVQRIDEVLKEALVWKGKEDILKKLRKMRV